MKLAAPFIQAHACHADWSRAVAQALAQLADQFAAAAPRPSGTPADAGDTAGSYSLGWCYVAEAHAASLHDILDMLHRRLPGTQWVGSSAVGVAACGTEYFDEPAVVLMLAALPPQSFRVFSGRQPLAAAVTAGFVPHTALVHGDPRTPDIADLLEDLAGQVATGYLFGGLASGRQQAALLADEVLEGGLSGVAFGPEVELISRVTQGCQPIGPARVVTSAEGNLVHTLDGEPALGCLLRDLGADPAAPLSTIALQLRYVLAGLSDPGADDLGRAGQFGTDVRVRHLVGLEPERGYLAVADQVHTGMRVAFSTRNPQAARRDLIRIATEIREELEGDPDAGQPARQAAGAIYVSCAGRGGPHFGAPHAELQTLRHALGDVPLVGFFAGGEIARHHLYGYTGVLTVFTRAA